jgi:hypothetical protein
MDLTIAIAVATPTIAALVAIITWRQWATNKAKLRHELFDRRYEVYERVAGFLSSVIQSGRVEPGTAEEFLRQTKKAYFVFGGDAAIKTLVEQIYHQAAKLHALQAKVNGLTGQALESNVDKQTEVKGWFQETLHSLEPRVSKYLRLGH